MKTPTLSLCMIVRNEEHTLPNCLNSVKDLVDEIIIVDTGSIDRTKEIASQFTSNIHDFAWIDDFSAARNEALKHATGDWLLILDADETLSQADHEKLRTAIANALPSVVAFRLVLRNYTNDSRAAGWTSSTNDTYKESNAAAGWWPVSKIRLFRNNKSILYSGSIHESVTESAQSQGTIQDLDIPIHHFGKLNQKDKTKNQAYEELSHQKIAEKKDFYSYFELGRQYVQSGKGDDAIIAFQKSIELNPDYFQSWFMLGTIYILEGDSDAALLKLETARNLNPYFAPIYVNLGILHAKKKEYARAIGNFERALSLNPSDANAYRNLGLCYKDMGDNAKARAAFEKAIELNPTLKEKMKLS